VSSQTLNDVFKRIDSLHATKSTRWQITASQYRPNVRDQALPVDCARELLGVTFTEAPDKIFFVLRQEHMVVEADATMQAIMERLQVYRNRLTVLFEGFQYELGDFRVKAGRAVLAPVENLRGIIMEVLFLLHILVLVVCLDFGRIIVIYLSTTHCQELMKSVGSHGSTHHCCCYS
jgi:mediator of RNA polymerase II transcription subunit 20